MLDDKMMVDVKNISTGSVSYYSELNRTKRRWDKPDTYKKVSLEELKELVNSLGGYELLRDFLLIKDVAVREELGLPNLPEHMLDNSDLEDMLNKPLATFKKFMKNASDSVRERIAKIAIDNDLSDTKKIDVIKEYTGIDTYKVIKEKQAETDTKKKG